MIGELRNGHMDARRAVSLVLAVVAYGLLVLALALEPGIVTPSGVDPRWIVWSATAFAGMAIRGYTVHRRQGTRNGMRWALAQGGLIFLMTFAVFVLASSINPIISSNPLFGGDAWAGLLALGTIGAGVSAVLWERDRHRQRIAAVLLVAACLIVVGIAGLRAGGPLTPIGAAVLITGVLGVAAAALQTLSNLVQETTNPAI